MQCLTFGIILGNYYGKRSCQPYTGCQAGQLVISYVTSLAFRSVTFVFGLGTRLCVRMHATLENGILRNEQQLETAVNSLIYQGEFVAMKLLSA